MEIEKGLEKVVEDGRSALQRWKEATVDPIPLDTLESYANHISRTTYCPSTHNV